MPFAAPQRFVRRQRRASLNSHDAAQDVEIISSPSARSDGADSHTMNIMEIHALRSRYNRMVGEEIEQMYGAGRVSSTSGSRYRHNLDLAIGGVDDVNALIRLLSREQLLVQILFEGSEPPDRDFLELPDQNDF